MLWERSIAELGSGRILHLQPLDAGKWLMEQLPLLHYQLGLPFAIEPELDSLPETPFDKQLLLVGIFHLLRAVGTAKASYLRCQTIDGKFRMTQSIHVLIDQAPPL